MNTPTSTTPLPATTPVGSAALVNLLTAAWNNRDSDTFVNAHADDCEITIPGGATLRGRGGAAALWHSYQDPFPDNRITVITVFGAEDEAVQEAVFNGTHTALLHTPDGQDITPTGHKVATHFSEVFIVRDGRIARARLYFDRAELFTQLGVM